MPRIRTLKPESLQHRKVGRLSDAAFRLWICLITQADDAGRLVFDAGQMMLLCWGFHRKVTPSHVAACLDEIRSTGLCRLYQAEGRLLVDLPSWLDHQRINKPTPSKLPPYQDNHGVSGSTPVALPEPYGSTTVGSEGRKEGRKERSGSRISKTHTPDPTAGQATATGSARQRPKASDCDTSFEQFWAEWPATRRVGKADALKTWRALNPTEELRSIILAALRHQKQLSDWQREGGRYIPYPHRWLAKRRWEDVVTDVPDPYAKFPRVSEGS